MRFTILFTKTSSIDPKDAETISHKLLIRGGFIDQLMAGVYTFLPLGYRVHQKIAQIIREEMENLGAQEMLMPAFSKKEQWIESRRWDTYDPPLFKFKDRHSKELALAPTHEEVITDLARRFISSYKDMPFSVFQFQDKFRNEVRPTGGLLRTREFVMKDLYSFHSTMEDLDKFYDDVVKAYVKIFERVGLSVKVMYADPGSIGGTGSHEFGTPAASGEDTMFYCENCDWAANIEKLTEEDITAYRAGSKKCEKCGNKIVETKDIENGHVFKLMTKYSEPMKAFFTDKDGIKKPIIMGCYGIGIGRLMATVVEQSHDDVGIVWPENIAPYRIHLISLGKDDSRVCSEAEKLYEQLRANKIEVIWDDRVDVTAGEKFADADLIGVPYRVVVSEKSLETAGVELKKRDGLEVKKVTADDLINQFK